MRDYLELYIIILYNMCCSSVGICVRVRMFVCAAVRVCWYMGACEGVCMRDYVELYIIILYNMCCSSVGICVRVRMFVCVGCSCVLVYGCV